MAGDVVVLHEVAVGITQIDADVRAFAHRATHDGVAVALAVGRGQVKFDALVVSAQRAAGQAVPVALPVVAAQVDARIHAAADGAPQDEIAVAPARVAVEVDAITAVLLQRAVRDQIAAALPRQRVEADAVAVVSGDRALDDAVAVAPAGGTVQMDGRQAVAGEGTAGDDVAVARAAQPVEVDPVVQVARNGQVFEPRPLAELGLDAVAEAPDAAVADGHAQDRQRAGCAVDPDAVPAAAAVPRQRETHEVQRDPVGGDRHPRPRADHVGGQIVGPRLGDRVRHVGDRRARLHLRQGFHHRRGRARRRQGTLGGNRLRGQRRREEDRVQADVHGGSPFRVNARNSPRDGPARRWSPASLCWSPRVRRCRRDPARSCWPGPRRCCARSGCCSR